MKRTTEATICDFSRPFHGLVIDPTLIPALKRWATFKIVRLAADEETNLIPPS